MSTDPLIIFQDLRRTDSLLSHFKPLKEWQEKNDLFKALIGTTRRNTEGSLDQLEYVRDHLFDNKEFDSEGYGNARSIVLEKHYIDRDFMEDFSGFHAMSHSAPVNHCARIHFFSLPKSEVEDRLGKFWVAARKSDGQALTLAMQRHNLAVFCADHYLGFTVIRPLGSTPVGRTVLRSLPEQLSEKDAGQKRVMTNIRPYTAHLMGLDLTVEGLAFQQQDNRIGACATVSVWCALHRAAYLDNVRPLSTVEITHTAARHRMIPSRTTSTTGLDINQMCAAVHAAGAWPYLVELQNAAHGQALVHAAVASGLPAILVLSKETPLDAAERAEQAGGKDTKDLLHSVTLAGMKVRTQRQAPTQQSRRQGFEDQSIDMTELYLHDDRIGPYRSAPLFTTKELGLYIPSASHIKRKRQFSSDEKPEKKDYEEWSAQHLLVPTYPKIRITLAQLRRLAVGTLAFPATDLLDQAAGKLNIIDEEHALNTPPVLKYRIWKNHDYVAALNSPQGLSDKEFQRFAKHIHLPRYVATVTLGSDKRGWMELVLDTTSTADAPQWLAIVVRAGKGPLMEALLMRLQQALDCLPFGAQMNINAAAPPPLDVLALDQFLKVLEQDLVIHDAKLLPTPTKKHLLASLNWFWKNRGRYDSQQTVDYDISTRMAKAWKSYFQWQKIENQDAEEVEHFNRDRVAPYRKMTPEESMKLLNALKQKYKKLAEAERIANPRHDSMAPWNIGNKAGKG